MPPKLISQRKQSVIAISGRQTSRTKASLTKSSKDDEDTFEILGESEEKVDSDEEIAVTLSTEDPNAIANQTVFSFKDYEYAKIKDQSHFAVLFFQTSKVDGGSSDEETEKSEETDKDTSSLSPEIIHVQPIFFKDGRRAQEEKTEPTENKETEVPATIDPAEDFKKLSNEFNFSERCTQTTVTAFKDKSAQTEPPSQSGFTAQVTQWGIYDYYTEHAPPPQEKNKELASSEKKEVKRKSGLETFKTHSKKIDSNRLLISLKVTERLINQNTYDEITQDFKYWEDLSDELKGGQGSLLPLWKFSYGDVRRINVTSINWNAIYDDLFVVSFGSRDFMIQNSGYVCAFALSNPCNPEFSFRTPGGVMSVDVHPERSQFLAAGFYDGNVAVFSLKEKRSVAQSDPWNGKHSQPVWKVEWHKDDLDGNLNFSSASGDGRITHWTMVKNKLRYSDILTLRSNSPVVDEMNVVGDIFNVGATSMSFHPTWHTVYLVGTEDGRIVRCNRAYSCSSRSLDYETHAEAVHAIQWNRFHPRIFISCSPDSTVKIWDYQLTEPICCFDLMGPVSDVKWAPYSATVFAAVTIDGKVHVYDLFVNKYQPICVQTIVPKKNTQLTCLAFSNKFAVILVGDNRGYVRSLKLSPNLRKSMYNVENDKHAEQEVANMDKCLAVLAAPKINSSNK